MATKTSVVLIDDLDGETPADTTVSFALDGKSYEIDLSDNNAAEFRDALSKYVSAGRKSGSTSKGRAAVRHTTTDSIEPAAGDLVEVFAHLLVDALDQPALVPA